MKTIFVKNKNMLIFGKVLADKILEKIEKEISEKNIKPTLGVVLVGENPESLRYIKQKKIQAEKVGMNFVLKQFSENVTEEDLKKHINLWNQEKNISAYIIQLPLPKNLDEKKLLKFISPEKDADGFHVENIGKCVVNDQNSFVPCTPKGVIELLKNENFEFEGSNVVVIGRSNIVGKPVTNILINLGATVTVCNSKTKSLDFFTRQADAIIVATGRPKLIKKSMVKENAIIIDVGFTVKDGKIFGDVDIDSFGENFSQKITPVPGGVGKMTVACLLENTLKAFNLQNEK